MVLRGECRSHDPAFLDRITAVHLAEFEKAAASVRNTAGECGSIQFTSSRDYHSFDLERDSEVVLRTEEKIRALGSTPLLKIANGGLDANWLNQKGIPTVTLGAGQHNAHTLKEYVDIREYLGGCELALSCCPALNLRNFFLD